MEWADLKALRPRIGVGKYAMRWRFRQIACNARQSRAERIRLTQFHGLLATVIARARGAEAISARG